MYLIIWEFHAAPGHEEEFERAYGPQGDWVSFFRRDPSYLGTELFRDTAEPRRFLTLDRWTDHSAFEAFQQRHHAAYHDLDRRLTPLCTRETKVAGVTVAGQHG